MISKLTRGLCIAAVSAGAFGAAAGADTFTFDSAVATGATQAPGVWYTDRYAPAGFSSPVFFDGDNRLKHSISVADGGSNRPGGQQGQFYNTQGRKYDVAAGTMALSIDVFVPSDWGTTGRRMAGLWGSAPGSTLLGGIAYPIVEFASDGAGPSFRGWDASTGWVNMGLPAGFAYDSWYTLEIQHIGNLFVYSVDGELTTNVSAHDADSIANVILQGHNYTDTTAGGLLQGVSYDIHWDNLVTTIPLPPAAWAGLSTLAGVGLIGVIRRRRLQS